MRLDDVVIALDAYFRVPEVRGDAPWGEIYDSIGGDWWRDRVEPSWPRRWNGLMVRGRGAVQQVVTCVFPSDAIVSTLGPGTLLFSEHPVDFRDVPGFIPLSRESFERLRDETCGFYHVHAPLDMHPEVSPSRLCAAGVGLDALEEYFPICEGIDGGAAVIGETSLGIDALADAFRAYLGPEIPITVISRPRAEAGRVAVVAGGGAQREVLEASIARGCETYVTGNAATNCVLDFVQADVAAFRALAEESGVALIDATHYGMEKPPQLAMVEWFERRGLPARFAPGTAN